MLKRTCSVFCVFQDAISKMDRYEEQSQFLFVRKIMLDTINYICSNILTAQSLVSNLDCPIFSAQS